MATNTLTDQNISNTYTGLLHAQGEEIPSSGLVLVYDGDGNSTSLSIGRQNRGASITGGLSSNSLSASGISYPITDGTTGQFLQTNGSGKLTFSNILSTSLPDLVPNPSNTYVGLSAISVDSKGRVTNVVTSGSGSTGSDVYMYATPIVLVDTLSKTFNSVVSVSQSNMPSGATFAILYVDMAAVAGENFRTNSRESSIIINGVTALRIGSLNHIYSDRQDDHYTNNNSTIWYGLIDASNNISVQIIDGLNNLLLRSRVLLLGYATYNQLSNP